MQSSLDRPPLSGITYTTASSGPLREAKQAGGANLSRARARVRFYQGVAARGRPPHQPAVPVTALRDRRPVPVQAPVPAPSPPVPDALVPAAVVPDAAVPIPALVRTSPPRPSSRSLAGQQSPPQGPARERSPLRILSRLSLLEAQPPQLRAPSSCVRSGASPAASPGHHRAQMPAHGPGAGSGISRLSARRRSISPPEPLPQPVPSRCAGATSRVSLPWVAAPLQRSLADRLDLWQDVQHGSRVLVPVSGQRVAASYAARDAGLLIAGPLCPAQGLFSTRFDRGFAVVLGSGKHVALAHVQVPVDRLTDAIADLQQAFRQKLGFRPMRIAITWFEGSLRAHLGAQPPQAPGALRARWSREQVECGRRLLAVQDRIEAHHPALQPHPAGRLSHTRAAHTDIDAICAYTQAKLEGIGHRYRAVVGKLPGKSVYVDLGRKIKCFQVTPMPEITRPGDKSLHALQ